MAHDQDPAIATILLVIHLTERRNDLMDEEEVDAEALGATTIKRDELMAMLRAGVRGTVPAELHGELFLDKYDDAGKPL